jgi:Tat protein translocase TatB subunit
MFGIGMQEVFLILVIALVVIGPKKLPEVARALGKGYAEFRRAFDEMKHSVETDLRAEEFRKNLIDIAPPSPVVPPPPPEPASGSLLIEPPAPLAPSPYPEAMDGTPPPPEGDGNTSGGTGGRS